MEVLTFLNNRTRTQYRGRLGLEQQAEVIARAVGPRGPHYPDLVCLAELALRSHPALLGSDDWRD
jgi:cation transport regulator ChaC